MGVRVVGVSLEPGVLELLDAAAEAAGSSRSGFVAGLVLAEVERRSLASGSGAPVVTVDGVRYAPVSRDGKRGSRRVVRGGKR